MSTQSEKLISLLKKLFQSDQAELDFGMYKVINQRRDEINRFLEVNLLPQIKDAFLTYQSVDTVILQNELKQAMRQAEDLGVDPDTSSKVKGIQEQIATYSVDVNDLENQVYSALYNFFRRYYDEGDFISQRRYKEGVYAIPYEGEEVKLYWANHDQYYIKTSEYFRDYSFKLRSGKRAHFKLVEADTEKDNRKEIDDNKRRFVLAEDPLAWQDGEVVILFEFRPEKANQSTCNEMTLKTIFGLRKGLDEQIQKDALTELAHPAPTEGNPDRTLLEKHLEDYTRRNTQDYFIHKDLGKFLRRELDFYIKNEIMHLDNIENESAPRVEEYLSKIKVIRQIARKIIDFLAQIEDFQKKLWLKKKFVVETHYCITLDRIPEELYPEIAANDAQREEWARLFAIDEIDGSNDLFKISYSDPLTVNFLKSNPFLIIDTKFYNKNFKYRLLNNIDNFDDSIDGEIFQSENYQALNLLSETYKKEIQSIYLDPPYNAAETQILYKNNFRHSSWISMIDDRIPIIKKILTPKGIFCITIDDYEFHFLKAYLDSLFGEEQHLGTVVIRNNPSGRSTTQGFAINHEYGIFYSPSSTDAMIGRLPHSDEQKARYDVVDKNGKRFEWENLRKSSRASNRTDRPKQFYPFYYNVESELLRIPKIHWNENLREWEVLENPKSNEKIVWPLNNQDVEKVWSYGVERSREELKTMSVRNRDGKFEIYKRKYLQQRGVLPRTWWDDSSYSARDNGAREIKNLFGSSNKFDFPKAVKAVKDSLLISGVEEDDIVLDYFAGSGTTAQAVIELNRQEELDLKFILIEMGEHFDFVLKPRILKSIYSDTWRKGKPVSRNGIGYAFKYTKLESYEDSLNNITLKRPKQAQAALLDETAFSEDYLLHYMLNFESQGSLLDLERIETPFDYQLQIASSTVGETEATPVDLVETFNYLLGLHVRSIRKIDDAVVVRGTTREEKQILVIWRTVPEMDNDQLNDFFKAHLAGETQEITDIYVNGDNNLANIRPDGQHWKVHLTEESFHRLMFEEG